MLVSSMTVRLYILYILTIYDYTPDYVYPDYVKIKTISRKLYHVRSILMSGSKPFFTGIVHIHKHVGIKAPRISLEDSWFVDIYARSNTIMQEWNIFLFSFFSGLALLALSRASGLPT